MSGMDNFSSSDEEEAPLPAPLEDLDDPGVPDPTIQLNFAPTWDKDSDEFVPNNEFVELQSESDTIKPDVPAHNQPKQLAKVTAKGRYTGSTLTHKPLETTSKHNTHLGQAQVQH